MPPQIPGKIKRQVRGAYLAGEGSLRELGKRYKIHWKTLGKWAAEDGWVEARERVLTKAQVKADERVIDSMTDVILRHRTLARNGLDFVTELLKEARKTPKKRTPANAVRIMEAAEKGVKMERVAIGLPGDKPVSDDSQRATDELVVEPRQPEPAAVMETPTATTAA